MQFLATTSNRRKDDTMQDVVYFCLYAVQLASSQIPGRAIGLYSQLFQIVGPLSTCCIYSCAHIGTIFFIDKRYDKRGDGAIRVAMPSDPVFYSYKHMRSGGNWLFFSGQFEAKVSVGKKNQRNG